MDPAPGWPWPTAASAASAAQPLPAAAAAAAAQPAAASLPPGPSHQPIAHNSTQRHSSQPHRHGSRRSLDHGRSSSPSGSSSGSSSSSDEDYHQRHSHQPPQQPPHQQQQQQQRRRHSSRSSHTTSSGPSPSHQAVRPPRAANSHRSKSQRRRLASAADRRTHSIASQPHALPHTAGSTAKHATALSDTMPSGFYTAVITAGASSQHTTNQPGSKVLRVMSMMLDVMPSPATAAIVGLARDSLMREFTVLHEPSAARSSTVDLLLTDVGSGQTARLSFAARQVTAQPDRSPTFLTFAASGTAIFTGAPPAMLHLEYRGPGRPLAHGPLMPPKAIPQLVNYRTMPSAYFASLLSSCGQTAAAEAVLAANLTVPDLVPLPLIRLQQALRLPLAETAILSRVIESLLHTEQQFSVIRAQQALAASRQTSSSGADASQVANAAPVTAATAAAGATPVAPSPFGKPVAAATLPLSPPQSGPLPALRPAAGAALPAQPSPANFFASASGPLPPLARSGSESSPAPSAFRTLSAGRSAAPLHSPTPTLPAVATTAPGAVAAGAVPFTNTPTALAANGTVPSMPPIFSLICHYHLPFWDALFCTSMGLPQLLQLPVSSLRAYLDHPDGPQRMVKAVTGRKWLPRSAAVATSLQRLVELNPAGLARAKSGLATGIAPNPSSHYATASTTTPTTPSAAVSNTTTSNTTTSNTPTTVKLVDVLSVPRPALEAQGWFLGLSYLLNFFRDYIHHLQTHSSHLLRSQDLTLLLLESCKNQRVGDVYTLVTANPSILLNSPQIQLACLKVARSREMQLLIRGHSGSENIALLPKTALSALLPHGHFGGGGAQALRAGNSSGKVELGSGANQTAANGLPSSQLDANGQLAAALKRESATTVHLPLAPLAPLSPLHTDMADGLQGSAAGLPQLSGEAMVELRRHSGAFSDHAEFGFDPQAWEASRVRSASTGMLASLSPQQRAKSLASASDTLAKIGSSGGPGAGSEVLRLGGSLPLDNSGQQALQASAGSHSRFAYGVKRCAVLLCVSTILLWCFSIVQVLNLKATQSLYGGVQGSMYVCAPLGAAVLLLLFYLVTALRYWKTLRWRHTLCRFLTDALLTLVLLLCLVNGIYSAKMEAERLLDDGMPMDVVHLSLFLARTVLLLLVGGINHVALRSGVRRRRPRHKAEESQHQLSASAPAVEPVPYATDRDFVGGSSSAPTKWGSSSYNSFPIYGTSAGGSHRDVLGRAFQQPVVVRGGHLQPLSSAPRQYSINTAPDSSTSDTASVGSDRAGPAVNVRQPLLDGHAAAKSSAPQRSAAKNERWGEMSGAFLPSSQPEVRVPAWAGGMLSTWLLFFTIGSQMDFSYFSLVQTKATHPWLYVGSFWLIDAFLLAIFLRGALVWDDWSCGGAGGYPVPGAADDQQGVGGRWIVSGADSTFARPRRRGSLRLISQLPEDAVMASQSFTFGDPGHEGGATGATIVDLTPRWARAGRASEEELEDSGSSGRLPGRGLQRSASLSAATGHTSVFVGLGGGLEHSSHSGTFHGEEVTGHESGSSAVANR